MWDREKLTELARERKAALSDVEGALLAFARTREMTEETGVDAKEAQKALDAALDKLEPEAAERLHALGSVQRDEVLRDFLVVMLDHNQQRLEREHEEVHKMELTSSRKPSPDDDDDDEDGGKKRKRGRRF